MSTTPDARLRAAAPAPALALPRPASARRLAWPSPGRLLVWLLLLLGAGLALLPFMWMLVTSVKPAWQVFTTPPQWLPQPVTLEHYGRIVAASPFPRFLLNSVVVAVAVTAGQVVTSAMAAYAFARLRFPGRDLIFVVFLGTLMIPEQVTYIPLFMVARFANLVDSYAGLILPAVVTPFGIFLLRQSFMTVPAELEDAARIDGAGQWAILWRVMLPVVKPALVTVALFAFLHSWNAYFWPLIVTQTTDMRTLAVGLRYYLRDPELGTDWGALMAAAALVLAPVIGIFLATQRQFVAGLLSGSLKG